MPYPEQWLRQAIETAAGCPAYPQDAPEGAGLPYVVYERLGTERVVGPMSTMPVGTFSVLIFGGTYAAAKGLAEAVRPALHNFSGTASGVTISLSIITDERDGDPVFFDGQDRPTFCVEQTYSIRWQET